MVTFNWPCRTWSVGTAGQRFGAPDARVYVPSGRGGILSAGIPTSFHRPFGPRDNADHGVAWRDDQKLIRGVEDRFTR